MFKWYCRHGPWVPGICCCLGTGIHKKSRASPAWAGVGVSYHGPRGWPVLCKRAYVVHCLQMWSLCSLRGQTDGSSSVLSIFAKHLLGGHSGARLPFTKFFPSWGTPGLMLAQPLSWIFPLQTSASPADQGPSLERWRCPRKKWISFLTLVYRLNRICYLTRGLGH